jgi:hypothetical protein
MVAARRVVCDGSRHLYDLGADEIRRAEQSKVECKESVIHTFVRYVGVSCRHGPSAARR